MTTDLDRATSASEAGRSRPQHGRRDGFSLPRRAFLAALPAAIAGVTLGQYWRPGRAVQLPSTPLPKVAWRPLEPVDLTYESILEAFEELRHRVRQPPRLYVNRETYKYLEELGKGVLGFKYEECGA